LDVASHREIRQFAGHSASITSIAFSPDGRTALSASRDSTLKLWDIESGRELKTFSGHSGEVDAFAFAPDGRTALSASADKTLKLWDLGSGRPLRTYAGHSKDVESVAISPDGRRALSASSDQTIKLWDIESGRELKTFPGHLTGRTRGQLLRVLSGHPNKTVTSLAFSPDCRTALSISSDDPARLRIPTNAARLWNLADGTELHSFATPDTGLTPFVAFSPNGREALVLDGFGGMKLWDIAERRELLAVKRQNGELETTTFSPTAAPSSPAAAIQSIVLWDAADGKRLRTFTGQFYPILALAFSPDGRSALSASVDGARLWDVATGSLLKTFNQDAHAVAFSPDGHSVLTGSGELRVRTVRKTHRQNPYTLERRFKFLLASPVQIRKRRDQDV